MRLDAISPRPRKDGKTYWHKIGAAFEGRDGGWNVVLDSLPLPDAEGRVSFILREPKERDESTPQDRYTDASKGGGDGFEDSEIPF